MKKVIFSVEENDVVKVKADLLLLKYARNFYGADKFVADILVEKGVCKKEDIQPPINQSVIIETRGIISSSYVMFLGTDKLYLIGYDELFNWAQLAIQKIAEESLLIKKLATTIHGPGYGLDPIESLIVLAHGFQVELKNRALPLEEIVFVEKNPQRAQLAQAMIPFVYVDSSTIEKPVTFYSNTNKESVPFVNRNFPFGQIEPKEHVFVAMPYSSHFQDVYEFGIYNPVRECGYICEKLDQVSFTGDILHRIQQRIREAKFVIADLTGARPNVYLEVGFAWGCQKDVILIAEKNEKPHFDVVTHRTIFYENISHLAKELKKLILEIYGYGSEKSKNK